MRLYDTSYTSIYLDILGYRGISDACSARWFFFNIDPQDAMQCACVHVTPPETYAEVRNLGVKAQGGEEWYVTGYTSIS